MKKLLYRLPSSRSFTRLFSILAVAVVAFAALELLFVQQALAGIWCCKRPMAPPIPPTASAMLQVHAISPRSAR